MADLGKIQKSYTVISNVRLGQVAYLEKRKGLIAGLARWLHKRTKWHWLERHGYGVMAFADADYKTPIGIAIDSKTILISGTAMQGKSIVIGDSKD